MNKISCIISVAAVTAVAMTCTPSHAGLQLENQGVGCLVLQENSASGESNWSSAAQMELGTITASVGSNPMGTASAGLDWLEDGTGFQFTNHFQHGDINDPFTMFQGRMESMVKVILDEPMQLDYSYDMNFDESTLYLLNGRINLSSPGGSIHHTLNQEIPTGSSSYILEAGLHNINLLFVGQTYEGIQGSGEMSMGVTMRFTALPAPGALALLGLAGCASRRRRRA